MNEDPKKSLNLNSETNLTLWYIILCFYNISNCCNQMLEAWNLFKYRQSLIINKIFIEKIPK